MRPRFHPLRVATLRRTTSNCTVVGFDVPAELRDAFRYRAGQYLTLRTTLNGEELRRSYSLCSAPYEQRWEVAVKQVPQGRFSTFVAESLALGDTLDVMPPTGNFAAPSEPVRHVVGFAAGSGITPVISILKQLLHEQPAAHATLFYGSRTTAEIILREELEQLKNTYLTRLRTYHVLSREDLGSELFGGRIDAERCAAFADLLLDLNEIDHYYLCGPEPMIRAVSETLTQLGVAADTVHFELFGAPVPAEHAAQRASLQQRRSQVELARVDVTIDGKRTSIEMLDDGLHLLEAALAYGLDLPFACKGGVCSTCKCKVTEGEVAMDVNYALEPDEVEAGYVLSCQARPISDRVAVDFDA